MVRLLGRANGYVVVVPTGRETSLVLVAALTTLAGDFGANPLTSFLQAKPMDEPEDVSLVCLIATPDRYHGKLVRVIGYLEFHFEGSGLYLHGDDVLFSILANAVYVERAREIWGREAELTGYALLEGVFDREATGHRGSYSSGGLVKIRRWQKWPPDCLRKDVGPKS